MIPYRWCIRSYFYCNSSEKKNIFLFSYLCVNNRNLQEINWFFTWFQNGRFKWLALILILNIIMSVFSFFFCIRFNNLEANSQTVYVSRHKKVLRNLVFLLTLSHLYTYNWFLKLYSWILFPQKNYSLILNAWNSPLLNQYLTLYVYCKVKKWKWHHHHHCYYHYYWVLIFLSMSLWKLSFLVKWMTT